MNQKRTQTTLLTLTTVVAALFFSACGNDSDSSEPDYPLYICSLERKIPYTDREVSALASWFGQLNTATGPELVDKLKELNPRFTAIAPVNSSYCSSGKPDFHTFESKYRAGISMYKAATLAEPLQRDQKTFVLKAIPHEEIEAIAAAVGVEGHEGAGIGTGIRQSPRLSFRPSTTKGQTSDLENSIEKYVTWIQAGDEYMRVEAWDSLSGEITVTRGFDGTEPLNHAAGTPVLSPVYIGVLGHTWSGYFPGGFQNMLRYALRIDHPDVHRFKANEVIDRIRTHHLDGVWLDIMGYNFFNQSNMHGEQVIPWNFEKKMPYTAGDYRDNQQRKAEGIREVVERELGRKVILLANNFSNKYFPYQGGGERLLQSTKLQPTPIDGMILEGIGGEYLHDNFRTGPPWLKSFNR